MIHLFFLIIMLVPISALPESLEILRKIPHSGYSEGLEFFGGYLWHAKPEEIVKIDPKDGVVLERFKPATKYSESLTWFKGKLWNVSYSDNGIYQGVLKKGALNFSRHGDTPDEHAWGLTHDGKNLIMTGNYSSKIYFLDPSSLKIVRFIETSVKDIEDLAWDGKGIWSSSFTEHRGKIFRIDPRTGVVGNYFSLPDPDGCPIIDGIAFDGKDLWVTGKHCPSIYHIAMPSERLISSKKTKEIAAKPEKK